MYKNIKFINITIKHLIIVNNTNYKINDFDRVYVYYLVG